MVSARSARPAWWTRSPGRAARMPRDLHASRPLTSSRKLRCQTLRAAEPTRRGGERTMLRERVHARVTALAVAGLRVHAATSLRRPGLERRRRVSAAARGLPSGPSTPRLAAFVVLVAVRGGAVRRLTAAALHARGQVGPAVTLGGRAGRMAASGGVVGSS